MATIIIKDKNLKPENIKSGVTILKVTGSYEGQRGTEINNQDKTVDSSTVKQVITADSSYTGLGTVTVNEYELDSKTVDASTVQQVITSDADGLSSVTVNPYELDSKAVYPTTSEQVITSNKDGLSSVTVRPVTYLIDNNITQENIKSGVTILGVTGIYDASIAVTEVYGVNPSTNTLYLGPTAWQNPAVKFVTVYGVDASIDSNIKPENIKDGVTILGVTGNYAAETVLNQKKSVTPTRSLQRVVNDQGYTGMDEVTVYGVDSSIDSNIVPGNIKSGVNILGVEGTYAGSGGGGAGDPYLFTRIDSYTPNDFEEYNYIAYAPGVYGDNSNKGPYYKQVGSGVTRSSGATKAAFIAEFVSSDSITVSCYDDGDALFKTQSFQAGYTYIDYGGGVYHNNTFVGYDDNVFSQWPMSITDGYIIIQSGNFTQRYNVHVQYYGWE